MSNLELVVKERNKAFYQLEVSEAEDGIQPFRHERNEFGKRSTIFGTGPSANSVANGQTVCGWVEL